MRTFRQILTGVIVTFAVAMTVVAAVAISNPAPAGAATLATFESCDHLRVTAAAAAPSPGVPVPFAVEATVDAGAGSGRAEPLGRLGTNTQVAGVDELDLVDVTGPNQVVVALDSQVQLIDVADGRVIDTVPADGAQLSYDPVTGFVWFVTQSQGVTLSRAQVTDSGFGPVETWTADGVFVDLRRDADQVTVVLTDPWWLSLPEPVPFNNTSPVECDDVLYPTDGLVTPAATLIVTFPTAGDLTPAAATEIVGAASEVLVSGTSVYVTTPQMTSTWIHRFTPALTHVGSVHIEGHLLNQFSFDEHDERLRVAVTHRNARMFPTVGAGRVGTQPEPAGSLSDPVTDPASTIDPSQAREILPEPVQAQDMPAKFPDLDELVSDHVSSDLSEMKDSFEFNRDDLPVSAPESDVVPLPDLVIEPDVDTVLNEIVVVDTATMTVTGRSVRFGEPWETIHGIRFAGDVAYAVTFLTTDPFYVIDLSDRDQPVVQGQLKIPGFSAYLHPVAGHVLGFGPDSNGRTAARLFDVSDPTNPTLADSVTVGVTSPVVYDHHALRVVDDTTVIIPSINESWMMRCNDKSGDCSPRMESAAVTINVHDGKLKVTSVPVKIADLHRVVPVGETLLFVASDGTHVHDGTALRPTR